jgi:hypothetical protein
MNREQEKLELERKLALYRALELELPDTQMQEAARDVIEDLEQQLGELK